LLDVGCSIKTAMETGGYVRFSELLPHNFNKKTQTRRKVKESSLNAGLLKSE